MTIGVRRAVTLAFVIAASTRLAVHAEAQQLSAIAGVVRDASGAVLPGVTVEAASPALIEKVRTVVTDGAGQYRVVDLRPGLYTVTVALPGFSTVKREGIELPGGFTATVNMVLQVGALEETVTVTGASPLVDAVNTRTQAVVSDELLSSLPTGTKGLSTLISITPGLTGVADVGGSVGAYRAMGTPQSIMYHGRTGMKVSYDGMGILNMAGNGNVSYIVNSQTVEEMTMESGGVSAESSSSGFAANGIPKEGSNSFRFEISGLYTDDNLQSNNLSDDLRARGVTTVDKTLNVYDTGMTAGGPLKKDKLWFFGAIRAQGSQNQKAGLFHDLTHDTPLYTPDPTRPATRDEYNRFYAGRLTWQVSAKNKVNVFTDFQNVCRCIYEGFETPEAAFGLHFYPQQLTQVTWTSPRTTRLLFEGGVSLLFSNWTDIIQDGVSADDIGIQELSTGLWYHANDKIDFHTDDDHHAERFSVSYVTGSHVFKAGVQVEQGAYVIHNDEDRRVGFQGEVLGHVTYRFLRGVPNGIVQYATPAVTHNRIRADLGLFVQDQWRLNRLTLNYGVRFDYFNGYVPAQQTPASTYLPARSFPAVHGAPLWKDLNPRFGGAYDLFGDGRTALKASVGRYVGKTATMVTSENNPLTTTVASVTRTWTDGNGNFAAECDLRSSAANGECGVFQNLNFGSTNPSANRYDEDLLRGYGVRDSLWNVTAEVQQQFGHSVSMTAGYYRSWESNFRATDNLEVVPGDFSTYCIKAPVDPRLPNGGGYDVCGLADVAPSKFGRISNLVSLASNYGEQTLNNDFFSVSMNGRFARGVMFGGGFDTGRSVANRCFVIDSPQELVNCRIVTPFGANNQVKLFGNYPLPAGFMVSGTFKNTGGPSYEASYAATNAEIAPSLGRNLAACGTRQDCTATVTVPLITPQTQFEDRLTQLDLRLTRTMQLGSRYRLQANFDVYNVFNASSMLTPNNTYGSQWRVPVTTIARGAGVLNARLFQFSGRLSF